MLSNGSIRPLRTSEDVLAANEAVMDGLEHNTITPKKAEQMNQCIKTPMAIARLEMQLVKMLAAFGRKAPVPRSSFLRSALGLPAHASPKDGEHVRALISSE